jgi:cytochrome b561
VSALSWRNTPLRYGKLAIALHWIVAAAILFMFWLGPYMAGLSETDPWQFPLFQLHKSIGLTILVLMVARVCWRFANPVPALPPHMPAWERASARVSHGLLYAFAIAVPLLGWATVSAAPLGIPTMWFGLFEWPHLSFLSDLPRAQKRGIEPTILTAHAVLAFTMMALVALHIAAALKHHVKDRDNVLKHMLPWPKL